MHQRYHYLPDARPPEARVLAWKARERMPDQLGWTEAMPGVRVNMQGTCPESIYTRPVGDDGKPFREYPHMLLCPCSKSANGGETMGGSQRQPKPSANLQHEPSAMDHSREPGGGGYFGHTRGQPTPFVPNEDEQEMFDAADALRAARSEKATGSMGEQRVPVLVPHRDACSAPLLGTLCAILGALLVWRWRRR